VKSKKALDYIGRVIVLKMSLIFIMGCAANLGSTSCCIHTIPDKTSLAIGPGLDPAKVAISLV